MVLVIQVILLISSLILHSVYGHGYLKSPRSRNFVAYEDGVWYGGSASDQTKESCPHCLNIGGTRASCGITGSRNYDFPKNVFGESLAWSEQATYVEEAIIDVEVVLTAHHRGHFVMKACPLSEKAIPDEACFDSHVLDFVSDELYGAPKDSNYPARGYVAPSSGGTYETSGVYGMLFHHKYKLPKGVKGKVLLQWKYYTGNSCVFPGYDRYPFPGPGWTVPGLGVCASISPDGSNPPPEMFWNCAEINIEGEAVPTISPTFVPTKSPVIPVPTSSTSAPTKQPQPSPSSPTSDATDKKVVAYYASWQYYDRNSLAKPENFDYSKIDRINFAFFQPDTQGNLYGTDSWGDPLVLYGPYNYSPQPGETCFNSWVNPGAKVCNHHQYEKGLIHLVHEAGGEIYPSIGGWTLSGNFPVIAASASTRQHFANQCVELIKDYGFDGIDIDWEYPGYSSHGGTAQDRLNFNLLLDEVRARLDGLSAETGKRYGLTAALPCGPSHIYNIDIPHISNVLDELLLMSYDLHGSWDPVTGVNAPLNYQGFGDDRLSVDGCVNMWKNNGAPASKISIGLGFYGRSFKDASALNQSHQGTDLINWSIDDGLPQYFSIVERVATGSLKSFRHDASKTPYAYFENGSGFVSYDDERSICEKTEYVINNDLNGFLIWELSGDLLPDLSTPLLDSVNRKLVEPQYDCSGDTTVTSSPTHQGTLSPTKSPNTTPISQQPSSIGSPSTNPPVNSPTLSPLFCPVNYTGLKATNGCTQYYSCSDGYMVPNINTLLSCPAQTLFDETLQICNWMGSVTCTSSPTTSPPTSSPTQRVTSSPTSSPMRQPTSSPVSTPIPPTSSPTCPQGYTGLRPAELCHKYYHCVNGVFTGPLYECSSGTLFDIAYQICNWDYLVTCEEKPTYPTPSPTNPLFSCPPTYTGLRAAEQCTHYYHCVNGQVTPQTDPLLPCAAGTLFDETIQNCNWANQVNCTQ